jgi:hypothetical protein
VIAHDLAALEGEAEEDGEGSQVGNDYRDATDPGDRVSMDFAGLVWLIQQTPADGEVPTERCQYEGGSKSRGGEYE